MLPTNSPQRLVRAQAKLNTIYEFISRYEQWKITAGDDQCDFALGNPQTMALPGFVNALRDATTPENKDWYAYKSTEDESRDIVRNTLKTVTGRNYDGQDILLTNGATGALLVTMNSLIETGDEVIYNSPPWFFYEGMILNQGGVPVAVRVNDTTSDLDLEGIERAITNSSCAGATILDPFAGSGSTLIACDRTARIGAVIELDPRYCDVILARWEAFTDQVAERIDD